MKLPLLAAALALALAFAAAPAQAGPRVVEYPLPAEFAVPNDIAAGPDGALWATDGSLGVVWRITTGGKISSYKVGSQPAGITVADGVMWIADASGNRITRVTTDGASTPYPVPTPGGFPTSIVQGPDGAIWFTEARGDKIGRLAADGTFTEFPLPTRSAFAGDIMAGPDGALWFSEAGADKVGRITTAGEITEFPLPAGTLPGPIVTGPDGALYLAERNTNAIARMTTAGVVTDEFPLATEFADPFDLLAGPDGKLYVAQLSGDSIARMTFGGVVEREFRLPSGRPDALTLGPDGAIWFSEGSLGQLGRLDIRFDPPVTAAGVTFHARAFVPATRTVATFTDADPNARPGDYAATIAWGDGTRSGGTVRRAPDGTFEVRGRHTYFRAKTFRVVVRITDGVGHGVDARVESEAVVRE